MWLFHFHSMVNMQPFCPVFPPADSKAKVRSWLSLWNFKEKNINRLYDATIQKKLLRFYRTQPLNILIRSIAVEGDFAQFPLKGVKLLMRQRNFGCAKVFNYPLFPAHSRNRDDEVLFMQHPRQ